MTPQTPNSQTLKILKQKMINEKKIFAQKKILITHEVFERVRLRRSKGEAVRSFCENCQRNVSFLRVAETTELTGLTTREICRLTETGALHFIETTTEHLLVCASSVIKEMSI